MQWNGANQLDYRMPYCRSLMVWELILCTSTDHIFGLLKEIGIKPKILIWTEYLRKSRHLRSKNCIQNSSHRNFNGRYHFEKPLPRNSYVNRITAIAREQLCELIASIFRVEKTASEEPEWAGGCWFLARGFSTLKMEAIRSSETSVHTRYNGATSQKTAFFIVTAVKTSNPTRK
jgi:hypothetical protein